MKEKDLQAIRGGAWYGLAAHARAACRLPFRPDARDGFVGFRIVEEVDPRVLRGGSWGDNAAIERAVSRRYLPPVFRHFNFVGFRIIEGIKEIEEPDPRRMVRGGTWDYDAAGARAAYRDFILPVYRFRNVGFRIVEGVELCRASESEETVMSKDSYTIYGGAWLDNEAFARAAYRSHIHPDYRGRYVGFRIMEGL